MPPPLIDYLGMIMTPTSAPAIGDVPMRGASGGWTTLPAGSPGSVLTIDTVTNLPTWEGAGPALWRPTNALAETIPRTAATGTYVQATGALLCYGGVVLHAGTTYSNVNAFFTTAGSAVTHTWAGLVRYTDGNLLAVSADNTAAPTANAIRTWALGTAYTPTVDTPVYVAIMLAATTVPTLAAAPAMSNANLSGLAPVMAGSSNTAQTTPLAVGTIVNVLTFTSQVVYAYLT